MFQKKFNKFIVNIFTLILLTLFLSSCEPDTQTNNKDAWELVIYDANTNAEQKISAADIQEKLLVINYWAEWCKPCITEIPELNHFAETYKEQVIVLGMNFDNKQGEALQKAMQTVDMRFPAVLTNPTTVFETPDINGLPTTLIVNAQGEIQQILLGPQTLGSLEATLTALHPSNAD